MTRSVEKGIIKSCSHGVNTSIEYGRTSKGPSFIESAHQRETIIPGKAACICNPSTQEAQTKGSGLSAILGYTVSFRLAWVTWVDLVLNHTPMHAHAHTQ